MFLLVEKPRQTTKIPAVINKLSHFIRKIIDLLILIEFGNEFKMDIKEKAGINA